MKKLIKICIHSWLLVLLCSMPLQAMQWLGWCDHTLIVRAINKDEPTLIQELLKKGTVRDGCLLSLNGFDKPILRAAIGSGSIQVVQCLLTNGFNVNYHPDRDAYLLPLNYAFHCQTKEIRPKLINLLVRHGAQLFEEHQNGHYLITSLLWRLNSVRHFLQAPRVAPCKLQEEVWRETEKKLVALVCSLNRLKKKRKIRVSKDIFKLLCTYTLMAEESILPLELGYWAQKKLLPQEYVLQKLLDAHVTILHKTLNIKVGVPRAGSEDQPFYTAIDAWRGWFANFQHEALDALQRLLNPDPEKIREQLGVGIKENYRQLLFGKKG